MRLFAKSSAARQNAPPRLPLSMIVGMLGQDPFPEGIGPFSVASWACAKMRGKLLITSEPTKRALRFSNDRDDSDHSWSSCYMVLKRVSVGRLWQTSESIRSWRRMLRLAIGRRRRGTRRMCNRYTQRLPREEELDQEDKHLSGDGAVTHPPVQRRTEEYPGVRPNRDLSCVAREDPPESIQHSVRISVASSSACRAWNV